MLTKTEAQDTRRIPAAALRAFLVDALRACGLPQADAAIAAAAMLEADLTGSDAHGVFRLAGYVRQLQRGAINPRPNIRVLERSPATALIDGDPCNETTPCSVEEIQASDGHGLRTVDSSHYSGSGTFLTELTLTGDALSWSHNGTPQTIGLTP